MLIAGLLAPTRGLISVDGQGVDRPQTNLGIVFQNPVLLAWRSALDNVEATWATLKRRCAEL